MFWLLQTESLEDLSGAIIILSGSLMVKVKPHGWRLPWSQMTHPGFVCWCG